MQQRDKVLAGLIGVSAALAIVGQYCSGRILGYAFKPLATFLIFLMAAGLPSSSKRFRNMILAGLLFSLGGDVFLMLPADHFMPGLICFLIAHICYLVAFTTDARFGARLLPFLFLGIAAGAILAVLWPTLPAAMRIPVVVYVLLLTSMASQASARWKVLLTQPAAMAAAGGVLFMISDATLAINRFSHPFAAAAAIILGAYYAAQFLIARSSNF